MPSGGIWKYGKMTVPDPGEIGFFRHILLYLYYKKGGQYVPEIHS